jgi:hypothetical protein
MNTHRHEDSPQKMRGPFPGGGMAAATEVLNAFPQFEFIRVHSWFPP